MPDEKIQIVATAQDRASATLKKLSANVNALGGKGGALGKMGTLMGGINPLALAAGAGIGILTANILDGVKGALEEEKQLGRLDQAIKNNIKNTDGARAAFDNATTAAMDLAFADDDTRESLIKLVPATRNAADAVKDMHLAMDIARGRNIDLATATDIVVKAEMGNTGALRRMGIAIDKTATSTEILSKLQEIYGGQAEEYANSTAGRLEAKQIKVNEAFEDAGGVINELIAGFLDLDEAIRGGGNTMADAQARLTHMGTTMQDQMQKVFDLWGSGAGKGLSGGGLTEAISDNIAGAMKAAQKEVGPKAERLGTVIADDINTGFVDGVRGNKDFVKSVMQDLMFAIQHPLKAGRERTRIEAALNGKAIAEGLKSSNPDIRLAAQAAQQLLLTQLDALTPKAAAAGADAGTAYSRAFARNFNINIPGNPFKGGGGHSTVLNGGHAAGGYIGAGEWSVVGERGPELVQAGRRGASVTANHNLGGSGPIHVVSVNELRRLLDEGNGRMLALAPSSSYSR